VIDKSLSYGSGSPYRMAKTASKRGRACCGAEVHGRCIASTPTCFWCWTCTAPTMSRSSQDSEHRGRPAFHHHGASDEARLRALPEHAAKLKHVIVLTSTASRAAPTRGIAQDVQYQLSLHHRGRRRRLRLPTLGQEIARIGNCRDYAAEDPSKQSRRSLPRRDGDGQQVPRSLEQPFTRSSPTASQRSPT